VSTVIKASLTEYAKLDQPLLFIAFWIRDMQHPMDTNTGTCVDMVGASITERLYLLGNAESRACGSPQSSQVQITPARRSQGTFLTLIRLRNAPSPAIPSYLF
jgi:hypothetical protein